MSVFPYTDWVARAVRGAKYGGERDRAVFLGSLLATTGAADLLRAADIVVPVPMYHGRERERGYNQAECIAQEACRLLGLPAPVRLLVQREQRRSQVGLGAQERRSNLRRAFVVGDMQNARSGQRIVIVDDVRTTGSTLIACADALSPLRPSRIDLVTVAAEVSDEALALLARQRQR